MKVFIDTYAFIALMNPRDRAHALVAAYLEGFAGKLLTTEWVLMEVADALSSPLTRSSVIAYLTAIRADPFFEIVGYMPEVYEAGFHLFASRHDKA